VPTVSSIPTNVFQSSDSPTSTRIFHQGTPPAIIAPPVLLVPAITVFGPIPGQHPVRRASDATATSSHCASTATDCVDLSEGTDPDLNPISGSTKMGPTAWCGVAFGILIILGGLFALASRHRKKLRRVCRFVMMKEKRERQAVQRQERAQERELDDLGSNTGRRRAVDVQNDLEANNQANGPTVEVTDPRNPPSRSGSGEAGSRSDKTEVNKTESESDQDRPSQESSTAVQGGKKICFPPCTWSSSGFLY
jgi:hypothetical protein